MWRMCVRTVLVDTTSSDAISDAVRLLGRYLTTRSSASLSSSRSGAAGPRRGAARPASVSRIVAISVAWAVRCLGLALEQLAARPEQERQDQAFGLGELERGLERLLGRAPVAEPIASRGVEQQCLDARPALGQRRRGTVEHRRQRLDRSFRVVLFELQGRERDAHPGAVALVRAQVGERDARADSVSPIRTRTWSARPRTSTVKTCSPASSRSRSCARANSASGFVEAALAEAQHAAGVVEHDLGPGVGRRAQRLLRASEMALGLREAPHPHERHAGHRERAGRHRLARPAMLLGNRESPARSARARAAAAARVSGAAIARCARQPISMKGREIRRVRAERVLEVLPRRRRDARPTAPRCPGS